MQAESLINSACIFCLNSAPFKHQKIARDARLLGEKLALSLRGRYIEKRMKIGSETT